MLGRLSIWLGLIFASCAAVRYPEPPNRTITINTSTLSKNQQAVVKEATDSWYRQTKGCVKFTEVPEIEAQTRIIHMIPVDKYNDQIHTVLGMCVGGIGQCREIEIAWSELLNYDQAIIVVAHELGHALGLEHNLGEHSLMLGNVSKAWLGLSLQDRIELLRVTGCNILPEK